MCKFAKKNDALQFQRRSMIMGIQNLVKFCPFILKICMGQKPMLASIKGRNSVANLRKTTIYNTNVDLVNDDVYIQNLVLF